MVELTKHHLQKLYSKGLPAHELAKIIGDDIEFYLGILSTQGLRLTENDKGFIPEILEQPIEDTTFCIVDIETNGSKLDRHQVIEIGALKVKNGKILDGFNSLLHCNELPDVIAELTGITLQELKNAPSVKDVMHRFKLFLGDHLFVAHALKFDYDFISEMFMRTGLGAMYNPGLCTINLAERTLSSAKYGLGYLNETLQLEENFKQHRAYNDALITAKLLQVILEKLPKDIKSIRDLINFSQTAKRMPRAPLIEKEKK